MYFLEGEVGLEMIDWVLLGRLRGGKGLHFVSREVMFRDKGVVMLRPISVIQYIRSSFTDTREMRTHNDSRF